MPRHTPAARRSARILQDVGSELKRNPPKVLTRTKRKKGKARAEKQRVAILLNKARKRGADV